MKLQGAFTAIVTPFRDNRIDTEVLKALVERQIQAKISGIVPIGTTGESPTLTNEERRVVLETIVKQCRKRVLIIAGCGSNSTAKAISTTKEAQQIGADASLQVAPYYNKPNQEGLYRHFSAIADAVDLPMVLYNIPGRSGVNISVETTLRLFAHQNIIAIKEASNDLPQIMELISSLPVEQDRFVLSGEDSLAYLVVALGGHGVVSVAANLFPERVTEMIHSALQGQYQKALRAHYQLLPLFQACFYDTNPIPIKYMLAQQGLLRPGYRLPLTAPSQAVAEKIDAALSRVASR